MVDTTHDPNGCVRRELRVFSFQYLSYGDENSELKTWFMYIMTVNNSM